MGGFLLGSLDVRCDVQGQVIDAGDTCTAAGGHGGCAVVAHRPVASPVLDLAGFPGGEGGVQRDEAAGRPRPDVWQVAADLVINAVPEGQHRDDRQHRKDGPLQPGGKSRAQGQESDDDGGATDEDQVELRVNEGEFRSEENSAADYPAPPSHSGASSARGRAPRPWARSIYEGSSAPSNLRHSLREAARPAAGPNRCKSARRDAGRSLPLSGAR